MSKTNKTETAPKSKKNINYKATFTGLYSLAVALAELVTVYVFATQDNKVLLPVAVVLGLDSAIRFTSKFVK